MCHKLRRAPDALEMKYLEYQALRHGGAFPQFWILTEAGMSDWCNMIAIAAEDQRTPFIGTWSILFSDGLRR